MPHDQTIVLVETGSLDNTSKKRGNRESTRIDEAIYIITIRTEGETRGFWCNGNFALLQARVAVSRHGKSSPLAK